MYVLTYMAYACKILLFNNATRNDQCLTYHLPRTLGLRMYNEQIWVYGGKAKNELLGIFYSQIKPILFLNIKTSHLSKHFH